MAQLLKPLILLGALFASSAAVAEDSSSPSPSHSTSGLNAYFQQLNDCITSGNVDECSSDKMQQYIENIDPEVLSRALQSTQIQEAFSNTVASALPANVIAQVQSFSNITAGLDASAIDLKVISEALNRVLNSGTTPAL